MCNALPTPLPLLYRFDLLHSRHSAVFNWSPLDPQFPSFVLRFTDSHPFFVFSLLAVGVGAAFLPLPPFLSCESLSDVLFVPFLPY